MPEETTFKVGDFDGMSVEEIRKKLENYKYRNPDNLYKKIDEIISHKLNK